MVQRTLLAFTTPSLSASSLSRDVFQAPVSILAFTSIFSPLFPTILTFSQTPIVLIPSSAATLSANLSANNAFAIFTPCSASLTFRSSTLSKRFLRPAMLASCICSPGRAFNSKTIGPFSGCNTISTPVKPKPETIAVWTAIVKQVVQFGILIPWSFLFVSGFAYSISRPCQIALVVIPVATSIPTPIAP